MAFGLDYLLVGQSHIGQQEQQFVASIKSHEAHEIYLTDIEPPDLDAIACSVAHELINCLRQSVASDVWVSEFSYCLIPHPDFRRLDGIYLILDAPNPAREMGISRWIQQPRPSLSRLGFLAFKESSTESRTSSSLTAEPQARYFLDLRGKNISAHLFRGDAVPRILPNNDT